jgi:hypothetical protein
MPIPTPYVLRVNWQGIGTGAGLGCSTFPQRIDIALVRGACAKNPRDTDGCSAVRELMRMQPNLARGEPGRCLRN